MEVVPMKLFITMDEKEMLENIDQRVIRDFIMEKWSQEEKDEISLKGNESAHDIYERLEEQLENENKGVEKFIVDKASTENLLKEMHIGDIVEYIDNHTEYYISDYIPDLMEKIYDSGCMDDVTGMFTFKYDR